MFNSDILDALGADLEAKLDGFVIFPDSDSPEDDVEEGPVLRFRLDRLRHSGNAAGDLEAELTLILISPDTASERDLISWVGQLIGALEDLDMGQAWSEAVRANDLFSDTYRSYEITLPITFNREAE